LERVRQILCFGDSNTHGTPALAEPWRLDRVPEAQRWTSVAEATLGGHWRLIPEGQPGRTTVHPDPLEGGSKAGIASLRVLLESHRPLDAVVLMLGTNDLKQRFSASPTDVALGLERLIDCIEKSASGVDGRAPRTLVVVPVPIVETGYFADIFHGGADKSRALGGAIARMADRRGVPIFDAGSVASVDPTDGIHLSTAAHAAIGAGVANALLEMFEGKDLAC
jgi:lysophospholipase L1-like esterase